MVDTSGMAPSVEIRLLQEARQFARAAAEASGSGRRPRAPSRRLLEASGALENQKGAQWMTKDIKEADARLKKELREQRRHFRAAGLKAGEVIEAVEEEPKGSSGEVDQRAKGSDEKAAISEIHGVGWGLRSRNNGRELTTGETLEGGGKEQPTGGAETAAGRREGEVVTLSPKSESEFSMQRTWTVAESGSSLRKDTSPDGRVISTGSKRRRFDTKVEDNSEELALWTADDNKSIGSKKTRVGEGGGGHGVRDGGDEAGGKAQCEYNDCSRTAIFGVNGTVRYW